MTRTAEFIARLRAVVEHRDSHFDPDFSTDGPDFIYLYAHDLEAEAPKTNALLQTGDVVDHMDGWMTGEGTKGYYDALQKDLNEIESVYKTEND